MTPMNIGVVIGPCLLWAPGNAADSSAGVAHANGLVETMINSFDSIFPEGMTLTLTFDLLLYFTNYHVCFVLANKLIN